MVRNPSHEMMAEPNADELARQLFVLSLKGFVGWRLRPKNKDIWEHQVKPGFEKEHGRSPETRGEIKTAMESSAQYQTWSALSRASQELMWESVSDTVMREQDRISDAYERLTKQGEAGGSLTLVQDFDIPKGIKDSEIHLQPGGYALDAGDGDILAGALYESGGALYSRGGGIGTKESKPDVVMRKVGEMYPDFKAAKMLDIACSAGNSSTPYAMAWPDCEVHAIEVNPAMLRYAHARAEALGVAVHFHQMDAASMDFEDESFDLIVSHNAMHEMPRSTQAEMFKESFRLLKPGGVVVHQDVPLRFEGLDDFMKFERSWDLYHNGEKYWVHYAENDCEQMLTDAGFPQEDRFVGHVPQIDNTISWYMAISRKPG